MNKSLKVKEKKLLELLHLTKDINRSFNTKFSIKEIQKELVLVQSGLIDMTALRHSGL